MSRFGELLEKFQDGSEPFPEGDELARLLQESEGRSRVFYDAMMLEADLYESYSGIAKIRAIPKRRRYRFPAGGLISIAVALFVTILLVLLLLNGSATKVLPPPVVPAAPPPAPVAPPVNQRKHEEHEDRKSEIEREYQKGLREVERKRAEGKIKEAEEKLREIERERRKQLQRRGEDD